VIHLRLFTYVVNFDYGFAPNPFYGVCTLATCKPIIRRVAKVGDWIVGTGAARYSLTGHLVFFMRVSEVTTYDDYWADARFQRKKPFLGGSLKQAFGDNIYHRDDTSGEWRQANSHHSMPDGSVHLENLRHDTQTEKVLVGEQFTYWGGSGPLVPPEHQSVLRKGQGHRSRFPEEVIQDFIGWISSTGERGYRGPPREFARLEP
jgi:hypothetical protein